MLAFFTIIPIIVILSVIIIFFVVFIIIFSVLKNMREVNNIQQQTTNNPIQSTDPVPVKEKLVCEYCGGKYNPDDNSCPNCGARCN